MPFTKDFQFPSDEELNVPEIRISSSYLKAGALHLGKFCEKENNEFILCKTELQDPRKCLKEGKNVSECSLKFFCQVKEHCNPEFEQFAKCLNRSSENFEYQHCKNLQAIFDQCVLEKMNLKRPPFGWQAEVHIYNSERPKPEKKINYFPDAPDELPSDIKCEEPRFGRRTHFW